MVADILRSDYHSSALLALLCALCAALLRFCHTSCLRNHSTQRFTIMRCDVRNDLHLSHGFHQILELFSLRFIPVCAKCIGLILQLRKYSGCLLE